MKNIILAESAGFCYGVKRAVDITMNIRNKHNKLIYTLGPLIHNIDVVDYLIDNEIYPIDFNKLDDLKEGDVIIVRSHGISKDVFTILNEKKLVVEDATCPYVANIQKKVKKYFDLGYDIIIVGDSNHPEVVGINGWCDNKALVSKDGNNIKEICNKVCVVSQTTEKQENWEKVINRISEFNKEIIQFNTICSATDIRRKSAEKLSKKVDAMIILGGHHSSNTSKLYEVCKNNCPITFHVENSSEIPDEILINPNIVNIGVTAGASTPDWIIKDAIVKMRDAKGV